MKVLHDWDRTYLSRGWARLWGTSLLLYWLSQKMPVLYKFSLFESNRKKVEETQIAFMETLIRLDRLLGIDPIFGIRDEIRERYQERISKLKEDYNIDVRRHYHIGEPPNSRERLWIPPLQQSQESWHYDYNYVHGIKTELKDNELPVWHIDHPEYLPHYIDWLYETLIRV